MSELERRYMQGTISRPVIQRAEETNGDGNKVAGYAAVYDVEVDLGWYREIIHPGAFTRALRENQDVRALFNHNPDLLLGRTSADTLTLREDTKGLWYEAMLPDTQLARDLAVSLERGDITGSSFAFIITKEKWTYGEKNELDLREILDLDLFDVSPVTYPAYIDTTAAKRSRDRYGTSMSREWADRFAVDLALANMGV